uniref:Secreted protein n=1 Tax=Oryzias latipes TaxID=8090 RepID=A0A3P9LG04_ORYLA
MKSLWNWGSMTCITCFTWLVSHLSINSSRANSLSGPTLASCVSCILTESDKNHCVYFSHLVIIMKVLVMIKNPVLFF